MEQEEEEFELVLCRTSSPFDHQASFIPFPSTSPEENASTQDASNQHKPASSAQQFPTRKMISHQVPSELHLQQLFFPIAPLSFGDPINRYNGASRHGVQVLAKAMGYKIKSLNEREIPLVLADALTLIEKLTAGTPLTKRPRAMSEIEVRRKIYDTVPPKYFAETKTQHGVDIEVLGNGVLERATARYLKDLQIAQTKSDKKKQNCIAGPAQETNGCAVQMSSNNTQAVGMALDKIETWCDNWLNGDIVDADWDKMEE